MENEQLSIRWNNHQTTLATIFDSLLKRNQFLDCTLAAEGRFLRAHQIILSACSPYFENLLISCRDKHPIFILKDIKFKELKAILEFMYKGEVHIPEDELGSLLKAAESLQVKGFSEYTPEVITEKTLLHEENIFSSTSTQIESKYSPKQEINQEEHLEAAEWGLKRQRISDDVDNIDDVKLQYYDEVSNVVIQKSEPIYEFSNTTFPHDDIQTVKSCASPKLKVEQLSKFEDEESIEDLTLDDADDIAMDYSYPRSLLDNQNSDFGQVEQSNHTFMDTQKTAGHHQDVHSYAFKAKNRFEPEQIKILEEHFKVRYFQTTEERQIIATKTGLSLKQVGVWFSRRRQRLKKEYEKYLQQSSL